jgi:predicted nucleic acid-binding protein
VSLYLDTSVLVALFMVDALTARADELLRAATPVLIVSDFTAAEFASAVARRVRTGEVAAEEARQGFATFDAWTERAAQREQTSPEDVAAAQSFLRRLDLNLSGDAVNIAIARRSGADLATFDRGMAAGARALGLIVAA